ncbi:hypothetical protein [Sphingomonas sp. PAMC 26605]|uniref:hypothetical protein n=1 Tax=Sphingomonas sp. PAMC 26605 TaxID=1112214 RepID=UPI00026CCA3D|nr:hypothetical protein [Sphingomonas sp. PAMC 26605]
MTHSFAIAFAEPPLTHAVRFALAPFDAFTGARVTAGIDARIDGLPDVPVRNRSGLLVFTNLPPQASYGYRMSAAKAGYFDPPAGSFAANDDPRIPVAVPLLRLPTSGYPDDATLLRGMVRRGAAAIEGASVSVAFAPPVGGATPFVTRTDATGSFAAALRLPLLAPGEKDAPRGVAVTVTDAGGSRLYPGDVRAGRPHRFAAPLDLDSAAPPPPLVQI